MQPISTKLGFRWHCSPASIATRATSPQTTTGSGTFSAVIDSECFRFAGEESGQGRKESLTMAHMLDYVLHALRRDYASPSVRFWAVLLLFYLFSRGMHTPFACCAATCRARTDLRGGEWRRALDILREIQEKSGKSGGDGIWLHFGRASSLAFNAGLVACAKVHRLRVT